MKLETLLKKVDVITAQADMQTKCSGFCANSSKVKQGYLFIAVKGFKTDGHSYIKDAAEKGAACIICESKPETEIPYVIVKDTRKAMSLISAAWFDYPAEKLKLIGVTGTNGKTTITYLIKHLLESSGSKTGLIGTIENLIGNDATESTLTTPDSYELQGLFSKMVKEGCKYAVMEVSSHALVLDRVYGLLFETGIYTNLTNDHLDFHPSMEDYGNAKALLFNNSKTSVINIDDKYSDIMLKSSAGNILTYAIDNEKADFIGKNLNLTSGKTQFDTLINEKEYHVSINIPGLFTVYNTLAAITAGVSLNLSPEGMINALSTFKGVRGRAEVIETSEDFTVIVDYAHTPDALENIIKTARLLTNGRIHTLFGCGGDRDKTKRPLMGKIAMQLSDFVTITSDNPRTEDPNAIINDILEGTKTAEGRPKCTKEGLKVITDRREAIREALDILLAGDILLIAGKGHETYQILGNNKVHFDDREVVLEHLHSTAENKRKAHARA